MILIIFFIFYLFIFFVEKCQDDRVVRADLDHNVLGLNSTGGGIRLMTS